MSAGDLNYLQLLPCLMRDGIIKIQMAVGRPALVRYVLKLSVQLYTRDGTTAFSMYLHR